MLVWTTGWTNSSVPGIFSSFDVIVMNGPAAMMCNFIFVVVVIVVVVVVMMRPRKNGRYFADNIFSPISYMNIFVRISLIFECCAPNNNKRSLFQIIACRHSKWQAIIWNNDGIICWSMYASLGLDELSIADWMVKFEQYNNKLTK